MPGIKRPSTYSRPRICKRSLPGIDLLLFCKLLSLFLLLPPGDIAVRHVCWLTSLLTGWFVCLTTSIDLMWVTSSQQHDHRYIGIAATGKRCSGNLSTPGGIMGISSTAYRGYRAYTAGGREHCHGPAIVRLAEVSLSCDGFCISHS